MDHRLRWKNLRNNNCPKCASSLFGDPTTDILKCGNPTCDFVITQERFKQICGSMNKRALEVPMYANGREVEDLQKREDPECGFCHSRHPLDERCDGFV